MLDSVKDTGYNTYSNQVLLERKCPHGRMADQFDRRALEVTVEARIYPVEIYMASGSNDCFPAFASIRFCNNTPVSFVPAMTVHDQKHKRRPPFRYVVNECRTGFMDTDVFQATCGLPRYTRADNLLDFSDSEDDEFPCVVECSDDGELPATLVIIRKSGVYDWHWGKDCNNRVCCLMADFSPISKVSKEAALRCLFCILLSNVGADEPHEHGGDLSACHHTLRGKCRLTRTHDDTVLNDPSHCVGSVIADCGCVCVAGQRTYRIRPVGIAP